MGERRTVLSVCVFVAFIVCGVANAHAQNRVTISIPKPGEVKIDAEFPPAQSWWFRNAYASALGIAERVERVQAFEKSGLGVTVQKITVGTFQSDLPATKLSYSVNLDQAVSNGTPHVSWLADDRGYLMLADLLPANFERVSMRFNLPAGWRVESSIAADEKGEFPVSDPVKAVFFVGSSLRKTSTNVGGMDLALVLTDKWPFKDADAVKIAAKVMQKYVEMTGFRLPARSTVMITPPPFDAPMNKWWAETRGSTVALLLENRGDKLREHLTIVLTHELLHLWVPNSLYLEGDYDWFFEGFTLYIALRMALELDVIKFKGFLDTLAGAYVSYRAHPDDSSLLEASERRWTTGGSKVYVKGMLVAFLYDLLIRKESGGRMKLEDRYRELFNRRLAEQSQGNEVIIGVLGSSPAMVDFTKSYIENAQKLDFERLLPAYGLQLEASDKGSKLRVSRELSPEQRQLLRSLGY